MSEKVERGRTLLAESEEHRGSTELQVCAGHGAGEGGGSGGGATPIFVITPPPFTHAPETPVQSFIDQMDLTVALHRTFLRGDGQRRQGLSDHEKQQASMHAGCRWCCPG